MSHPKWTAEELRAALDLATEELRARANRWENSSCRDAAWLEDGDELLEQLRPQLEAAHQTAKTARALAMIEERAGQWVL